MLATQIRIAGVEGAVVPVIAILRVVRTRGQNIDVVTFVCRAEITVDTVLGRNALTTLNAELDWVRATRDRRTDIQGTVITIRTAYGIIYAVPGNRVATVICTNTGVIADQELFRTIARVTVAVGVGAQIRVGAGSDSICTLACQRIADIVRTGIPIITVAVRNAWWTQVHLNAGSILARISRTWISIFALQGQIQAGPDGRLTVIVGAGVLVVAIQ
jgi:hypothetical protein